MPGSENLIHKYVYSTPENIYCNSPFGEIWCGIKWVDHTKGIFVGFTYPSVSVQDQSEIYTCAVEGGIAASVPIAAAVTGCAASGGLACVPLIAAAIIPANELLRTTFFNCLRNQTDLSNEIRNQCDIGIYQKDLDSFFQGDLISKYTHCRICCRGFTGEYICKPFLNGNQEFDWGATDKDTVRRIPQMPSDDPRCVLCCEGITGELDCFPIG